MRPADAFAAQFGSNVRMSDRPTIATVLIVVAAREVRSIYRCDVRWQICGQPVTRHFCIECGSPIHTSSSRHPDTMYIKAGSFDSPETVAPAHQAWMRSKVAWATIPSDIASFETGR
jgi:hypothetical protein